jgi:hypothetical protein
MESVRETHGPMRYGFNLKKVLSINFRGDVTMFPLNRNQCLKFAAAGAFFALTAATPLRADELAQNLGPVGPQLPILTDVGTKRVMPGISQKVVAVLYSQWHGTAQIPTALPR